MTTTLDFDVAVLGAGSAGCCAAIAAARRGVRTVLVDRLGFPGGTSTAVLDTFYAFFTAGEEPRKLVAGIPDEPVDRLRHRGKVRARPNSFGSGTGFTYDPETLKIVWAQLLREAGVEVMLHTFVAGAEVEGRRVTAVALASKAGPIRVRAGVFVDATGDADLVALAGGSFQEDTTLQQPATTTFRMTPVDVDRFTEEGRPRFLELVRAARGDGYRLPGEGGSLHGSGLNGVVLTAVTRLRPPDLADPFEPGRAELDGLEQVDEWARFLRDRMPGFEEAEISAISPMVGVRETRRVKGRYTLSEDDVLEPRRFDDQITLCGAPIEDLASPETRWQHVPDPGVYGIPWDCLLPDDLEHVVVAGRCLSATHGAHASARSMATCMALGQAAGTAAAEAAGGGTSVADVDPNRLRELLRDAGALVEDEG
ncbi:MAG: FAD-dependent oxidoreductase [Actinobacteria bacterium]|nr:FAD-dependent oxidoreductase [Actinomycetota bacterium]